MTHRKSIKTHTAYLSLGSNLGDRQQFLENALNALAQHGQVTQCSSLYQTPPWGKLDQPPFLNCCVEFHTQLDPEQLLNAVKEVEVALGRQPRGHWAQREIDIDIISFDDLVLNLPHLTIPHQFVSERAFVLVPLQEIAPDWKHPVSGEGVGVLVGRLGDTDVVKKITDQV